MEGGQGLINSLLIGKISNAVEADSNVYLFLGLKQVSSSEETLRKYYLNHM